MADNYNDPTSFSDEKRGVQGRKEEEPKNLIFFFGKDYGNLTTQCHHDLPGETINTHSCRFRVSSKLLREITRWHFARYFE